MSEETIETPAMTELHALKIAHDQYATACHLFKTRVQFYHEEFKGIQELVGFFSALRDQCKTKIEQIEPPVVDSEPKQPWVIDVPEKVT